MTYLEKINGEYPNIPSMETRIQELTNELKELSSHLGGHETIAYKRLWDERVSLKRELAAVRVKSNICTKCGLYYNPLIEGSILVNKCKCI